MVVVFRLRTAEGGDVDAQNHSEPARPNMLKRDLFYKQISLTRVGIRLNFQANPWSSALK